MSDREALIRDRAYAIWENEGKPDGRHDQHWQQACAEIDEASTDADATPRKAPVKAAAPSSAQRAAKPTSKAEPTVPAVAAKNAKPAKRRTTKAG